MKVSYKRLLNLVIIIGLMLSSCGPVVFTSRPHTPPPPWFYPHRVESVRYVYFPEHMIYYDLSLRTYIYLDNGVWISAAVLPRRFNGVNLRRSRTVRIRDYHGDDIRRYHKENNDKNTNRRSSSSRRNN